MKLKKVDLDNEWKNFAARKYFVNIMSYRVYRQTMPMIHNVPPVLLQPILWRNTLENIWKRK